MEIINTFFKEAGLSSSLKTEIVSKRIRKLEKPHHHFSVSSLGKLMSSRE